MKKIILILIACCFLILLGVGGWQLYQYWNESRQGNEIYTGLEDYIILPEDLPERVPNEDEPLNAQEASPNWPEIDFAALRQINPDIVGWLYCEDTPINYPVVQGDDNSYYLKHLFDGTYNANGCLFLDCRVASDFSDTHSIIYGHHMQNGSMLSSIDGYKNQDYYEMHPSLMLLTPNQNYMVELFAGYVANVKDNAWEVGTRDELTWESWMAAAIDRSTFTSDVSPAGNEKILTLSTCSYEFSNARFVVLGVLTPEPYE